MTLHAFFKFAGDRYDKAVIASKMKNQASMIEQRCGSRLAQFQAQRLCLFDDVGCWT